MKLSGSLAKLSNRLVGIVAACLLTIGLCVAPVTYHYMDVFLFFLPWAKASGGVSPTQIYLLRDDCNYPPLWLYILTGVERVRLLLGASETGEVAVLLLKLPALLALCVCVVATGRCLRRPFGADAAQCGAIAFALCGGLWIDAMIWGQTDVPLCALLLAASWALLHDKPILGVCLPECRSP